MLVGVMDCSRWAHLDGCGARVRAALRSERGIALVLALIVLLTLTGLVLAFLSMSAFEPQISQNLTDTINARMLADSGVDFAYNTLVNTTDWSTVLTNATSATCTAGNTGIVLGAANTTLPGLTATNGTFTVRVRNDCQPNDNMMTGTTVENTANFRTDTNGRLVLESTGTRNNASRTISVVASRAALSPLIDAALAFPGVQADVNFNGSSFSIDGRDTNLGSAVGAHDGSAAPKFAVTTAGTAQGAVNATQIQVALANNQQNDVTGKNPSGGGTVSGDAAVTQDGTVTSQMVTDFVNALKAKADVTISSSPSSPVTIQNIGSSCNSNTANVPCNWGSASPVSPKIVYIKGSFAPGTSLSDPVNEFTSLDISGNSSGTGILIVENGHLGIQGNFNWNGPIIVTGNNVGIIYKGGGNQNILGGVIVNELRNDDPTVRNQTIINLEGNITGNAKMAYSKQALDLVQNGLARRMTTTTSWREK